MTTKSEKINIKETKKFQEESKNNEINLFGETFKLKNSQLLSKQKGKDNIIFLLKFGQEILNLKYLNTGEILYSPNGEYKRQNFIKIIEHKIIIDKEKVKNPELEEFKINIEYEKISNKIEEMSDFTYGLSEEEKIDYEEKGITSTKELIEDFKLDLKEETQDFITFNKTFINLNNSDIETYKKQLEQAKKFNMPDQILRIEGEIKKLEKNTDERKKKIKKLEEDLLKN